MVYLKSSFFLAGLDKNISVLGVVGRAADRGLLDEKFQACADVCPMDVLRMDDTIKKPVIKYLSDCMSCYLCERDCPEKGAIYVSPTRERRIPLSW